MHTMKRYFGPAALVAAIFSGNSAFAAASADPTGVWVNDTGRGAIEIKQCGAALCGHVVWVKDQADSGGCGRQIIGEATSVGSGQWDNGWIYSPERKKKYSVELTPMDGDKLKVKGYAGTKLFSKTMIWTRAPSDLVRCSTTEASVKPAPAAPASPPPAAGPSSANKPSSVVAGTSGTSKPETSTAPATAAPAPAPESKSAAAEPAPQAEEEGSEDGPDVAQLSDALGEFIKKGPDGSCKLDLPWVKVKFDCDK
jgi:uncharacterized protein (DUF2147 family)